MLNKPFLIESLCNAADESLREFKKLKGLKSRRSEHLRISFKYIFETLSYQLEDICDVKTLGKADDFLKKCREYGLKLDFEGEENV